MSNVENKVTNIQRQMLYYRLHKSAINISQESLLAPYSKRIIVIIIIIVAIIIIINIIHLFILFVCLFEYMMYIADILV